MVTFLTNHRLSVISLSNLFCTILSLFILDTKMLVVHQGAASSASFVDSFKWSGRVLLLFSKG